MGVQITPCEGLIFRGNDMPEPNRLPYLLSTFGASISRLRSLLAILLLYAFVYKTAPTLSLDRP